jgi:hypothetical protein
MDAAWVLASILVLAFGGKVLQTTAAAPVASIAVAVAIFAVVQDVCLRRVFAA